MTFEDILWNYGLIENSADYLEKLSIYVLCIELNNQWDKFFFVTKNVTNLSIIIKYKRYALDDVWSCSLKDVLVDWLKTEPII